MTIEELAENFVKVFQIEDEKTYVFAYDVDKIERKQVQSLGEYLYTKWDIELLLVSVIGDPNKAIALYEKKP